MLDTHENFEDEEVESTLESSDTESSTNKESNTI